MINVNELNKYLLNKDNIPIYNVTLDNLNNDSEFIFRQNLEILYNEIIDEQINERKNRESMNKRKKTILDRNMIKQISQKATTHYGHHQTTVEEIINHDISPDEVFNVNKFYFGYSNDEINTFQHHGNINKKKSMLLIKRKSMSSKHDEMKSEILDLEDIEEILG